MHFPITPLIDFLNSVICFFCAFKLYRSYQHEGKEKVIKYFYKAYKAMVVAYLFFSMPRLIIPHDSFILGTGFIMAHVFLFLAAAYFLMITVYILRPNWHRIFFWIFLVLALGAIILSVINLNYPVYDTSTGITNWNIDHLVGLVITILFALVLVPCAVFYYYQGLKSHDDTVKVRSLLIATGLILLMVSAYTYYSADTQVKALVSDLFSFTALLTIFFGVYYKRNTNLKNLIQKI